MATVLLMGIAIASVSSAAVFLGDTMQGLQNSVEEWIRGTNEEEMSSISVDYGINGTNGFLLADVRNTGGISLAVEEDGQKNWNMYKSNNTIDGIPVDWEYTSGSPYATSDDVLLDPKSVITINTTVEFPESGNSTEIEFTGPNNIRTSYVCFSENGACES